MREAELPGLLTINTCRGRDTDSQRQGSPGALPPAGHTALQEHQVRPDRHPPRQADPQLKEVSQCAVRCAECSQDNVPIIYCHVIGENWKIPPWASAVMREIIFLYVGIFCEQRRQF